jgi:hypothetical protein
MIGRLWKFKIPLVRFYPQRLFKIVASSIMG